MLLNRWSRSSNFTWKKSCTTCCLWNPMKNGVFSIWTGAGFLPIMLEFDISFRFLCWETTKLFDWKKTLFTNNKEHPNQQPKRRHGLTIVCFSWRSSSVCVAARSRQSLMQSNCLLSYLCVRCCALEICKKQHMTFSSIPIIITALIQ